MPMQGNPCARLSIQKPGRAGPLIEPQEEAFRQIV